MILGKEISYLKAAKWTFYNKESFEAISPENNSEVNKTTSSIDEKAAISDSIEKISRIDDISFPVRSRAAFQTRTLSSLPLSTPESKSAIESHIIASLQRKALSADLSGDVKSSKPVIPIDEESESTPYFKFLLWACGAMVLWKNSWMWPFILIILGIFIIKTVGRLFGVWNFLENHICEAVRNIRSWCNTRLLILAFTLTIFLHSPLGVGLPQISTVFPILDCFHL